MTTSTWQKSNPTAALLLRKVRRRLRAVTDAWSSSLRVRVVTATVVSGLIALLGLGGLLSTQVRDALFDERRDQVLADAAVRADSAQRRFDASTANSTQEVQQLANDTVRSLQETAVGAAAVVLLRSDVSTGPIHIVPTATDAAMRSAISEDLRAAVTSEVFQQWQSVLMPNPGTVPVEPALAIGSKVVLPGAGEHELFFIYSLGAEQKTLQLLQRTLVIGGLTLVGLLVLMTGYITRQVLDPVTRASAVAAQLSAGKLAVRMNIRGKDELSVLASTFNDMAQSLQDQIEQLAELSRMQQRFVSDVSHELRTPLTTIRMAAELLYDNRETLSGGHQRSVELLHDQLDRFEELLADLLEISRFDAGAAILDTEHSDLAVVVTKVIRLATPLAAERGSELITTLPAEPVRVEIDPRRIERLVRNLVINAIEHGEGRPIMIEVAADPFVAAVVVADTGVGMTEAEAEHVFDRFWRADPARTRTLGGTGLGLAISLEDARLHGGWLQAWGCPGEGARFRLTLPRRIGITIASSPLPLELDEVETVLPPTSDPAGPAALPELNDES